RRYTTALPGPTERRGARGGSEACREAHHQPDGDVAAEGYVGTQPGAAFLAEDDAATVAGEERIGAHRREPWPYLADVEEHGRRRVPVHALAVLRLQEKCAAIAESLPVVAAQRTVAAERRLEVERHG